MGTISNVCSQMAKKCTLMKLKDFFRNGITLDSAMHWKVQTHGSKATNYFFSFWHLSFLMLCSIMLICHVRGPRKSNPHPQLHESYVTAVFYTFKVDSLMQKECFFEQKQLTQFAILNRLCASVSLFAHMHDGATWFFDSDCNICFLIVP